MDGLSLEEENIARAGDIYLKIPTRFFAQQAVKEQHTGHALNIFSSSRLSAVV